MLSKNRKKFHGVSETHGLVLHPTDDPKFLGRAPHEGPEVDPLDLPLDTIVDGAQCHSLWYVYTPFGM